VIIVDSAKKFYRGIIDAGEVFQSFLLLALRLYWGYSFFQAGLGKLNHISNIAGTFASIGIPFPELNAYIVGYIECIGGACLIAGFASRLVAIPLAIVMVVALLTAHSNATFNLINDPDEFINQAPFTYLLTSLIIFAFGPGVISVDFLLEKLFKNGGNKG